MAVSDANEEEGEEDGGPGGGKGRRWGSRGELGDLDVLEVSALDEIDAGSLEGKSVDDFAKVYIYSSCAMILPLMLVLSAIVDVVNRCYPDGYTRRMILLGDKLHPWSA